jgi:predicted PurR-regulated permease PerM
MGHLNENHYEVASSDGWLSRERAVTLALIVATATVFYLCYRLLLLFLPALAWALALAVIAHPLHQWIHGRIRSANLAAALSVVVVGLVIVCPVIFVTNTLLSEGDRYIHSVHHS